jgi:hypothetical protein
VNSETLVLTVYSFSTSFLLRTNSKEYQTTVNDCMLSKYIFVLNVYCSLDYSVYLK